MYPLSRLRRILLGLFLLTAFADAAGKALATSPAFNAAARELVTSEDAARRLEKAARPGGNFEIFRTAARHVVSGDDLYAKYPAEHQDQFKYSPTFALLFAPFAWLPWPLALFLWNSLNALVLFVAIERLLPRPQALLALACLHLELLRGMQNAQTNALVAALIVLAFVALERGRSWRAAAAVALGASIKIFPLAALAFAIARRRTWRTGWAAVVAGALLVALPLLVTSPAQLLSQYESWHAIETLDAAQRWFSVMELMHRWTGVTWPNWPVQLAGTLALLSPLVLRRARWSEHRFRLLYLCSTLLYVVLFNHQAERASYLIALVGAAIWYASEPRARWRTALFGLAMFTIPVMSTLVPGAWLRTPSMTTYRLALPCLAIWLAIQWALLERRSPSTHAQVATPPEELRSERATVPTGE